MLAAQAGFDFAVGGAEDEPEADEGGGRGFRDSLFCGGSYQVAAVGIGTCEARAAATAIFKNTETR